MFVFEGSRLLFSHRDPATGAHADLQEVLALAGRGLEERGQGGIQCACDTPESGPPPA